MSACFNPDELPDGSTVFWGQEEEDGHITWLGTDHLAEHVARESGRGVSRYLSPLAPVWGRWR